MDTYLIKLNETMSVALLVIGGQYGNGTARKKKLEAEGYDYSKIQNCVNDLVALIKKYS